MFIVRDKVKCSNIIIQDFFSYYYNTPEAKNLMGYDTSEKTFLIFY